MNTFEKIAMTGAAMFVLWQLGAGAVRVNAAPIKRAIPREIDERALLWAIAEKETGNDATAIGRLFGERSKYQFTRDTWVLHSQLPFEVATTNPVEAERVAKRHLDYVRSVLRLRKLSGSVRQVAAAWHFGPEFAVACANGRYAHEVENLYVDEVGR